MAIPSSILHIKNMVCNRCIRVVNEELTNMGYSVSSIELGEVKLKDNLKEKDIEQIRHVLLDNGFELIDDRKSQIINRIKTIII